jgi:hypothetical protein
MPLLNISAGEKNAIAIVIVVLITIATLLTVLSFRKELSVESTTRIEGDVTEIGKDWININTSGKIVQYKDIDNIVDHSQILQKSLENKTQLRIIRQGIKRVAGLDIRNYYHITQVQPLPQ